MNNEIDIGAALSELDGGQTESKKAKKPKLEDVSLDKNIQDKKLKWPINKWTFDGNRYKFIASNPIEKQTEWLNPKKGNVKVTDFRMVPDFPDCVYCHVMFTDYQKQKQNAVILRTPVEQQLWFRD